MMNEIGGFMPVVYVFQGNDLAAPEGASEAEITGGVSRRLFEEGFPGLRLEGGGAGPDRGAYFEVPSLDGQGPATAASWLDEALPLPAGWRRVPIRQAISLFAGGIISGAGAAGRLFRAYHIMQWRRESVFCGSCGARNGDAPGELARLCPACGRLEFPRISPAVIVVIVNDRGQALLAHNRKFAPGVYSLIAGFNEAGENLEATVGREIREEVGLEVRDIRYVASQPWPFPNSLMLGFSARHAGGTIRPDGVEIEDAQWFSRDHMPQLPGHGSVSRYLIGRWLEGAL
jgi:NAD+ diphosphatase